MWKKSHRGIWLKFEVLIVKSNTSVKDVRRFNPHDGILHSLVICQKRIGSHMDSTSHAIKKLQTRSPFLHTAPNGAQAA